MTWRTWLLLLVLTVLAGGVLSFFGMVALKPAVSRKPQAVSETGLKAQSQPLVTFIDPIRGNKDGTVLIVEYGDYICPFCRATETIVSAIITRHPEVKFVWKDLPNPHYPGSDLAAEAALCAKSQGKFWEYHDQLFGGGSFINESTLSLTAGELGLDVAAFTKCLSSHEMRPAIERTVEEAAALGIDATPYFFINGKRYSGQMTYEQFEQAIRRP